MIFPNPLKLSMRTRSPTLMIPSSFVKRIVGIVLYPSVKVISFSFIGPLPTFISKLAPLPQMASRSLVSVAAGEAVDEMVSRAFQTLKFEELVEDLGGDLVVVKPNFADVSRIAPLEYGTGLQGNKLPESEAGVGLPRRGDQTSTEVVDAVTASVKSTKGVKQVVIAEASATPTWKAYFMYGIFEVARKHHARLVDLNNDEVDVVTVPGGRVLKTLNSPITIRKANVIVSIPVLKVWSACGVSINIKNMAGGTTPSYYGPTICNLTGWRSNPRYDPDIVMGQSRTLAEAMVDIASVNRAHLGIVDAITVMHNANPGKEFGFKWQDVKVEELGAVIGSRDLVAADAVGAQIMGFYPHKILHLNAAHERGLGTNDPEKIDVMGTPVERIRLKCSPMTGAEEIAVP